MTRDNLQNQLKNPILVFGLFWISLAILLFRQYGHAGIFFLPFILVWLLLGTVGFGILRRWRWWDFFLAPLLTVIICIPLSVAYVTYDNKIAEEALHEVLLAAAEKDLPAKFSIPEDDFRRLVDNASLSYTVDGSDYFFGVYDWWVSFPNGSECTLYMAQEKLNFWNVFAYCR